MVELGGRPLVAWAVATLARAETVAPIVVAAPAGFEGRVEEAVASSSVELSTSGVEKSTLEVVAGGATRSESVARALGHVRSEIVVIHDAARPLVTATLIDSVVRRLLDRPDADGVIAAAPLTDTVKRAQDGSPRGGPAVARTESRDQLWAAQTPQAFRTAAVREALGAARGRAAPATDEAMLIEEAGGTVLIEPASGWNLKVTTPEDLRLAGLLLAERRASPHG